MHSFLRLFTPVTSSEQEIRRHILWWIALRVLLFTLLLSIGVYLLEKESSALLPPLPLISFFLLVSMDFPSSQRS